MAADARRRRSDRDDEWVDQVFYNTVVALIVLIPVTYVLLIGLRLVLFTADLADYVDPEQFLIVGTSGVLYGSALMTLLVAIGVVKKVAADGPESVDIDERFDILLSLRAPLALIWAVANNMPDGRVAHIVVGVYWGVVSAGIAVLHTVLINKRSASSAWFLIALMEMILIFILIFGVLKGISDHMVLATILEVVPAAVVACALTYLVMWLGARIIQRGS